MQKTIIIVSVIIVLNYITMNYVDCIFYPNNRCKLIRRYIGLFIINTSNILLTLIEFNYSIMFLKSTILFAILLIAAILDIKAKRIPISIFILLYISGIILNNNTSISFPKEIIIVIAMLLIMLFINIVTHKGIGEGDIAFVILLNMFVSSQTLLTILFMSVIISGLYSLVLLVLSKVNKNTELPYIPFIYLSFQINLLLRLVK